MASLQQNCAVLLVEDDPDCREILADVLGAQGYAVDIASHGREAMAKLASQERLPEVVILDLLMPEMDGAHFLIAAQRDVPGFSSSSVVVLSAVGAPAEPLVPPDSVHAWLVKPIELDDLLAVMSHVRHGPGRAPLARPLLRFLARRGDDVAQMREAIGLGDLATVGRLARRLVAAARGYTLPELVSAGEKLAAAADSNDLDRTRAAIRELADRTLNLPAS